MSRPDGDCVIETQSDWGYSLGVAEWKGATGAPGKLPWQRAPAPESGWAEPDLVQGTSLGAR